TPFSLVRQEMEAEDILNRIFGLSEEKAAEAARRRADRKESDSISMVTALLKANLRVADKLGP
ncbi:MAG TPA: hypothetical protein VHH93_00160, partial [Gammaproteobacteria bacterium]|nr:hypothetical protein [Gammaproteobacteria bacterium]